MTHTFKLNIAKSKINKFRKYLFVVYGFWVVWGLLSWYLGKENIDFITIIFPALLLVTEIKTQFFPAKSKQGFVEIDVSILKWKYFETPLEETVLWKDISWIKFEYDGISFYKQSSFSSFLKTYNLPLQECKKMEQLIAKIAAEKNIKLVA